MSNYLMLAVGLLMTSFLLEIGISMITYTWLTWTKYNIWYLTYKVSLNLDFCAKPMLKNTNFTQSHIIIKSFYMPFTITFITINQLECLCSNTLRMGTLFILQTNTKGNQIRSICKGAILKNSTAHIVYRRTTQEAWKVIKPS